MPPSFLSGEFNLCADALLFSLLSLVFSCQATQNHGGRFQTTTLRWCFQLRPTQWNSFAPIFTRVCCLNLASNDSACIGCVAVCYSTFFCFCFWTVLGSGVRLPSTTRKRWAKSIDWTTKMWCRLSKSKRFFCFAGCLYVAFPVLTLHNLNYRI